MVQGSSMDATQLINFFKSNGVTVPAGNMPLFEQFLNKAENKALAEGIMQNSNRLMANWKKEEKIADIMQQPLRIPNGTVSKPYEAKLDIEKFAAQDITSFSFEGLEAVGLGYDDSTGTIKGNPTQSGDIKITFLFKIAGDADDAPPHQKTFTLIINPDPKSLWKSIESNKEDPFWKEDNVTVFAPLGDRHILVSSKRGRSHANVGSFREDDFSFAALENGWNIVVVADGAGSAKVSRKGSAMACNGVVDYFKAPEATEGLAHFDTVLQQYNNGADEETGKSLNQFVYNTLGKAAFTVHKELEAFAKNEGLTLKDLSATLIFTLWKKYDIGYVFLSFGVGDCPIAVLNKEQTEVTLMNWIDVGEFGGGTRFITMPEIFSSDKFATRFGFKLMPDFSYLVMMSDGIYDPKFVVEAALPKIENWQAFLADLGGKNGEGITVVLDKDNKEIEQQLSRWMDFWSPGNHDDRTLAIVF